MSAMVRPNLLVVSDLHLGEDLKPNTTPVSYLGRVAQLERELESFLVHYAGRRVDGRPWRLVVNGDMVDFMSVMIPAHAPASRDERQFGLAFGEQQSVAKLDCVFDRHPGVWQRLAEFVAAGNELVIVVGNHDVEFRFPRVQERFVERLTALMPAGTHPDAPRVRFCPWFYYEEERVYVEHGHQYDEFCAFDYQLHPIDESGGVALSIAHAGIRYFTNLVPSIDPGVVEHWSFVDYLRWALAQGVRTMLELCYFYGVFVWKALSWWSWLTDRAADAARRELHRAQLAALAADLEIAEEKMHALDGLRRVPVIKRLGKTIKTLFLDRFLVVFAALFAFLLALCAAPGWYRLAGSLAALALGYGANWLLGRRSSSIAPDISMRAAPAAIRAILKAPFVVFGHSHRAETVALPDGGVYYNTGSWANEDISAAFTHLLITGDETPQAQLCQWRGGASAPFGVPVASPAVAAAPVAALPAALAAPFIDRAA